MAKFNIQPVHLPLGLDEANACEIQVHYSLGDEDVDLHVFFFNGNIKLNISPILIGVPREVLESWQLDFSAVRAWVVQQVGAQLPEQ